MGNNNNEFFYCRLANCCTFCTAYLTFYGRYNAVFVFDPPMQNTIKFITVYWVLLMAFKFDKLAKFYLKNLYVYS